LLDRPTCHRFRQLVVIGENPIGYTNKGGVADGDEHDALRCGCGFGFGCAGVPEAWFCTRFAREVFGSDERKSGEDERENLALLDIRLTRFAESHDRGTSRESPLVG